jgi:hypothetical protein
MDHEDTQETILAQVRGALERWYEGDPFGYVEHCADEMTYFDPATHARLDGAVAIREHVAPLEGKISIPRFEIVKPKLQISGDMGVLTFNLNTYSDEGELTSRWNATEVYRRIEDQWRIVHAHWSTVQVPEGKHNLLDVLSSGP